MHRKATFLIFLLFTLFFSTHIQAEKQKTYTFGVVPQFEVRHIRNIWLPIFNAIEKETGYKLKLEGSPTISDFDKKLKSGRFDFAYMNPYQFLTSNKTQGYIPLVRDIERKLQGILVVAKESPIQSVSQLANKKIAFPSPNALGASLLVRADLKNNFNLNFESVYVKTHSSVYLNVLIRQTEAGGGVQKTFNQQKYKIKNALRVLHRTPKVAPHPIAAHPRIPLNVRGAIKNILLKLGNSEAGKVLLSKIPVKKMGSAKVSDYRRLKSMKLEKFYVKQ